MNKFNIGDKVRVSNIYNDVAKILSIWPERNNNEFFYWVKTTKGCCMRVNEKSLTKYISISLDCRETMKIKSYKMVIIPFEFVPHHAVFRYETAWWKRVVGTAHQAEYFIDSLDLSENDIIDSTEIIPKEALVALGKSNLETQLSHAYILYEFDVKELNR